MTILDAVTPVYYEVLRMGIQRNRVDVMAVYDVALRNADGNRITVVNPSSALTAQEKQAIAAIFQRDKTQFETATGLTEWVEPEEPAP